MGEKQHAALSIPLGQQQKSTLTANGTDLNRTDLNGGAMRHPFATANGSDANGTDQ